MNEDFLHYLWKFKYYRKENLTTQNGSPVEVISAGMHNTNAGPDFLNAKIKIADTLWSGNVEIHLNASDWEKHLHFRDDAYKNVILHVVYNADSKTFNSKRQQIPVLMLHFDEALYATYSQIKNNKETIACAEYFSGVKDFTINNWLDKLTVERLEQKIIIPENLLQQTKNNWNECFYISLARGFGGNLNSLAFETLAKSLPQKVLGKHKNSLTQIEALLFGQAGMLSDLNSDNEYIKTLRREYGFLKNKFGLKPIEQHLWKFLRLRPANFPTLRISQFAQLIHKSNSLLTSIIACKTLDEIREIFRLSSTEFWETHYTFQKESKKRIKSFGKKSIDILIINSIVPFLFLYGKKKKKHEIQEQALFFLEKIKAEQNKIITEWRNLGIDVENAYQSQALIQLTNNYCKAGKCLQCAIGNSILKNRKQML